MVTFVRRLRLAEHMNAEYQRAVEQYGQKVYAFASYSLRNRQDADDVSQEVLIKLWRHWRSIDPEKILAWLMRVTRNAVVDHVRRQQLADSRVDRHIEPESQAGAPHQTGQQDQGEARDRERLRQSLLESIQALDDPLRSLLILRDIQGMSYADVQGAMELSESQVKVYLHRGRRKLRENEGLRSLFERVHGIDGNPQQEASMRNDDPVALAPVRFNTSR